MSSPEEEDEKSMHDAREKNLKSARGTAHLPFFSIGKLLYRQDRIDNFVTKLEKVKIKI